MALQKQRLLVLRRQAARGEHFVTRQLKHAEREYFTSKRRLDQMRRSSNRHEWKTSGQYDIETAIRVDVMCPSCGSFDCVRASHQPWEHLFYRLLGKFPGGIVSARMVPSAQAIHWCPQKEMTCGL